MPPRRLLLIGIGALLLFAIARIPAGVAAYFFDGSAVTLSGYSGTIWSGQARYSAVEPLQFGSLNWGWKPTGLLRGRIEYDLETHGARSKIDGVAGVSLLGTVHARDALLEIPLEDLRAVQFGTTGMMTIGVESVELDDQWPQRATGQIMVNDLTMNIPNARGAPEPLNFGNFEGEFAIEDGQPLIAQIKDRDGPLAIEATFTLDPVGNYLLDGTVRPLGQPGSRIQNLLQFMPRETDGSYALGFSGQL